MNPLFTKTKQMPRDHSSPQLPAQAVQQVRGMLENISCLQNPEKVIQKVAGQNPLLSSVLNLVGNRDPQQVFFEECERQGVDPNLIINALK